MQTLLVVAGIPSELGNEFLQGLNPTLTVFAWLPLGITTRYTDKYAGTLYRRMCAKLRRDDQPPRDKLLSETRLILLFVDKGDESETSLFRRFRVEALVMPFGRETVGDSSPTTANLRGRMANRLVQDARRAIRHAKNLLDEIAWEVTNRDSRTCLLLPPNTFGQQMDAVFDYLKNAASNRVAKEQFDVGLRQLSKQMPTNRDGNRRYYMNQSRVVFKTQTKSGPRHGLAPIWGDPGHDLSCVLRGRLRCGASFDPRVHYDCNIPSGHSRVFPNCHGDGYRIEKARRHVNVAPNDNVR